MLFFSQNDIEGNSSLMEYQKNLIFSYDFETFDSKRHKYPICEEVNQLNTARLTLKH